MHYKKLDRMMFYQQEVVAEVKKEKKKKKMKMLKIKIKIKKRILFA